MVRYPLNLQFFAGDDSQEKTEQATPKKKQDLRKKGQVYKSTEVPTSFIMIGAFLLLLFIGGWMVDSLLSIFRLTFSDFFHWDLTAANSTIIFQMVSLEVATIVAPIMAVSLFAGAFGLYIQVGFLFSTDPLKFKLERLNPIKGFKKIFSSRSLVELSKSISKILLIGTAAFSVVWLNRNDLFILSQKNVWDAASFLGLLTIQIGVSVALVLLLIAILDFMYQKYDFEKENRMSKQELKDEHKKSEGDPLIKSKIKQRQRQMSAQRMMQEVPKADVVITNPTHFAVAIKYDGDEMDAPVIIAKGADHVAQKIKEVAMENKITVMENKFLARALYSEVEIGESVPEHLFQAVAEVLAYVYQLKGKI